MIAFTLRNIKLYLRDKGGVAFSLLSIVIVIGLYVLFLGDVYTHDLSLDHAKEMMDSWVMAGVLAITSMTTTLGVLGNMVRDKEQKIQRDFYIAPIPKWKIAGGYLASSYLVGVIMSLIAFAIAEGYIVANGGNLLDGKHFASVFFMILVTTFMNTSIMLFVVSLLKSMSAFTTISVIIGTLIGFLTGIYLPIGLLPNSVHWIIKIFPVSHAAVIFRNIMMDNVMVKAFENVPTDIVMDVKTHLGIVYTLGDQNLTLPVSLIYILVVGIVFFFAAVFNISRKSN